MNFLTTAFGNVNATVLGIEAPKIKEIPEDRFAGTTDKGFYNAENNTIGLSSEYTMLFNDETQPELIFELARLERIAWQHQTGFRKEHSELECLIDGMAYAILGSDEFAESNLWDDQMDVLAERIAPAGCTDEELFDLEQKIRGRWNELIDMYYEELEDLINPYFEEDDELELEQ